MRRKEMTPPEWIKAEYEKLDAALSEHRATKNKRVHEERGFKVKSWGSRGVPLEYGDRDVLDHHYRLLKDGKSTYVSEPYSLDNEGILKLARLIEEGWHVSIHNMRGHHNPGSCVVVHMSRERFNDA